MRVEYALPYFSYSPHIPNFIRKFIFDAGVEGDAFMCEGETIISLNDTQERIERFFTLLGEKLPLSVFLRGGEVCDKPITPIFCDWARSVDLGLCPECLETLFDTQSINYLDQNTECELCGRAQKRVTNYDIEDAIEQLTSNAEVKYEDMEYFTLERGRGDYILILNQELLKYDFLVSQDEMLLLNSIERPIVRLMGRHDSGFAGAISPCRFPGSALEYIFAYRLKERGINYIWCKSSAPVLNVLSVEGHRLILSGECGYLPLQIKIEAPSMSTLSIANRYAAMCDEDGCAIVTPLATLKTKPIKQVSVLKGENITIEHPNKIEFDDYKAAILSVLNEYKLKNATAVFLSENSQNSGVYAIEDGSIRAKALIKAEVSPSILLEKIKSVQNGEILVERYINEFGLPYNMDKRAKSLSDIFALFGAFIDKSIKDENLYEHASMLSQIAALDRSVKIDMGSMKEGDTLFFEPLKTLRSILSFKLAGSSNEMLFYALFESFCDYVNELVCNGVRESGTKECIVCGSFFSNKMFAKRLFKHSSNIYNIRPSRYLPLDGAGICLGGVFATAY